MAMTLYASNTTTPTVGSNSQLAATTSIGVYVIEVDVSALANGETVQIVTNSAAKVGGTVNAADTVTFTGGASAPTAHLFSAVIPIGSSANWQLKQVNGTARAFDWAIYQMT